MVGGSNSLSSSPGDKDSEAFNQQCLRSHGRLEKVLKRDNAIWKKGKPDLLVIQPLTHKITVQKEKWLTLTTQCIYFVFSRLQSHATGVWALSICAASRQIKAENEKESTQEEKWQLLGLSNSNHNPEKKKKKESRMNEVITYKIVLATWCVWKRPCSKGWKHPCSLEDGLLHSF